MLKHKSCSHRVVRPEKQQQLQWQDEQTTQRNTKSLACRRRQWQQGVHEHKGTYRQAKKSRKKMLSVDLWTTHVSVTKPLLSYSIRPAVSTRKAFFPSTSPRLEKRCCPTVLQWSLSHALFLRFGSKTQPWKARGESTPGIKPWNHKTSLNINNPSGKAKGGLFASGFFPPI